MKVSERISRVRRGGGRVWRNRRRAGRGTGGRRRRRGRPRGKRGTLKNRTRFKGARWSRKAGKMRKRGKRGKEMDHMKRIRPQIDGQQGGWTSSAVEKMVDCVRSQRALGTLIIHGSAHKDVPCLQASAETRPKLAERRSPRAWKCRMRSMKRRRRSGKDAVGDAIQTTLGHSNC